MSSQPPTEIHYFIICWQKSTPEKPYVAVYQPVRVTPTKDNRILPFSSESVFSISGTDHLMEFHSHSDDPARVYYCGTNAAEVRTELNTRVEERRAELLTMCEHKPDVVDNFPEYRLDVWKEDIKYGKGKVHGFNEWWDVVGFEFRKNEKGEWRRTGVKVVLPDEGSNAAVQLAKARLKV